MYELKIFLWIIVLLLMVGSGCIAIWMHQYVGISQSKLLLATIERWVFYFMLVVFASSGVAVYALYPWSAL